MRYWFSTSLILVGMSASLAANSITWSAPTAITTANATLAPLGTLVGAESWGGGNTTVTLGSGATIFFQEGTTNGSNSFATTSGSYGETSNNTAQYSNASNANFQNVLGDFEYDGSQVLTLNNLTIGQEYAIQLFALDDRGCCGGDDEWFSTDPSGVTDDSATFVYHNNDYVIGTFIANATTQSIYLFSQEDGGSDGGHALETNLNAIVLYDESTGSVPEPATLTLFAAGIAGLCAKWRGHPVRAPEPTRPLRRLSEDLLRGEGLNLGVAAEIVDIEREDMRHCVRPHCGHEPRVVYFLP